jgi:hypothetical protein
MQSYKIIIMISVLLTCLIIALYINFFVIPHKTENLNPETTVLEPEPAATKMEEPSKTAEKTKNFPDLPSLNESDHFIREHIGEILNQPLLATWLKQDDLIRRFVATVDNIANGENPSPNFKFLVPKTAFQTLREKDQLIPDPRNYARFDAMADMFYNLKSETIISLYHDFRPLINQAYAEMGYPDKRFDDTLMQALQMLLKTPPVEFPVYLEKKVITYAFKNPDLEALNPAQKMLLRTGARNMFKIKEKLKQLKKLLDLPAENG